MAGASPTGLAGWEAAWHPWSDATSHVLCVSHGGLPCLSRSPLSQLCSSFVPALYRLAVYWFTAWPGVIEARYN